MAKDLLVVWHNMSSGDTNVQHIIILDWNKEHLILIHALSKELSVFKWLGIFMLYQEYAICGRQKSAIFYWVLHQQKNNKKSWHLISDEASSMEARKQSKANLILEVRNYMFEFGEVALVRLYRATEPKFSAPGIRHCKGKEVFETDWSATRRSKFSRALNRHSLPSALRWIWSLYWK